MTRQRHFIHDERTNAIIDALVDYSNQLLTLAESPLTPKNYIDPEINRLASAIVSAMDNKGGNSSV